MTRPNETDVRNELTQDEKRATLLNDQRVREQAATYLSHTHDDLGGRFEKQIPQTVVGASPAPQYPAASPHHIDPAGVEPPLGYSIDEHPPVGESHEVKRSIQQLGGAASARTSVSPSLPDAVETAAPPPPSDDVERNK